MRVLRPSLRLTAATKQAATKWFAVIVALNVAIGMAYSVAVLRRDGDKHRDINAVLARMDERLDLQRSLLAATRSAPGPEPVSDAVTDGLQSLSASIQEDIDDLAQFESSLGADQRIMRDAVHHLQLITHQVSLVDPGTSGPIRDSFNQLGSRLSDARAVHADQARDSYRTADIESLLMMGLAALMAVFLHKKFVSARQSVEARAARERAQGEARFRSLVQNSKDVIVICNSETKIDYQTPSAKAVLGFENGELLGRRLTELAHPNDVRRLFAFCREMGAHPGDARVIEWRMRHRDGLWMDIESTASNLTDDPNVGGLVFTLRDVSAKKTLEEQLRHQAFHDSLTNLANRALFTDRVEHALRRGDRANSDVAVLFVDVDDFKTINDSLGHSAGDEVLVEIAQRLRKAVRPSDTVARLGGDEFAVLLEDVSDVTAPPLVADRILSELLRPVQIRDREIFVRASIGIASGGSREEGADELLRNADVAMYMAKSGGKGTFAVFEPTMHAAALERFELRAALERSMDGDEFKLHYQPIVDLHTGKISGMEALVRWQRDDELIPPAYFIPLAEETGLIHKLGRWVLMEACRQAQSWQQRYPTEPPLGMSVNVSARQVLQQSLVEAVEEALSASGLDPGSLTLEITENDLVLETDEIVGRFNELKRLGVRLAIDDFGTGYSSLSYLGRFPVDILKIDRSFMARLADEDQSALTNAIVELGHSLSLEVVAEGIEEPQQLTALQALKCGHGQGFYFARPLDNAGIEQLLDEGLPQRAESAAEAGS